MTKVLLYLASAVAVLAPAGGAPKPDAVQLAFCQQVAAYTKAVAAVANLGAKSSVGAIRKAQSDLRSAYLNLEQYANHLPAQQAPTMQQVAATTAHSRSPSAAQQLTALLDISPTTGDRSSKPLLCVPGSADTAHSETARLNHQLKYARGWQCGPYYGLAEVETRSPISVLGLETPEARG